MGFQTHRFKVTPLPRTTGAMLELSLESFLRAREATHSCLQNAHCRLKNVTLVSQRKPEVMSLCLLRPREAFYQSEISILRPVEFTGGHVWHLQASENPLEVPEHSSSCLQVGPSLMDLKFTGTKSAYIMGPPISLISCSTENDVGMIMK